MNINKYKSNPLSFNKNLWHNSNIIADVNEFNEVIEFGNQLGKLHLTPNGHLSKSRLLSDGATYANVKSTNSYEYVMLYAGKIYRFVFIPGHDTEDEMTGVKALKEIEKEAKDLLKPYAMRNNADVQAIKEQIQKPWIKLTQMGMIMRDLEIEHVYHIDIHSAYPAGLCATHPEFKEIYERHYKLRKENEIHKAVLNYSIGAMQSLKIRGNRYPELSRDAINWTIAYLERMTKELRDAGLCVLGYNTDGIFVRGFNLFHNELEGDGMGQWRIDHIFDKIRFKSAGAYEYIENGEYHAVVRGIPKSLSQTFVWGDIYKHHPKRYMIDAKTNKILEVEYEAN